MPNARLVAVKALMSVNLNDAYSNITLDNAISAANLSGADASLTAALFYGVLDRKLTLDYIIKAASARSGKTPDFVREVLRVSVYQLVFMDKIPPHAAVNEAVKLIKKSKFSFAAGFVNAVLRRIIAGCPKLPEDDSVQSLCIRYSCNEWIVKCFVDSYGVQTAKRILESALEAPPTYIRVNTLKASASLLALSLAQDGVKSTEHSATALIANGAVDKTKAYANGLFHVQDLACQMCCEALEVKKGMRVLDCCAAPGGKAFTLAEIMGDSGEVIACDIYPHRVKLIADGAQRLGLSSVMALQNDATVYNSSLKECDRVLCDVVCSGLGVIRRKPDIKYKSAEGLDALPELQYKILESNARYLKRGGVLVYSTCTLRKEENGAVVSRFLAENGDFEPYPFENGEYMKTLMPYGETDGFFYARLKRK